MTITAQAVRIPALGINGYLVRVIPPATAAGVTVFRVCWFEKALGGARREAGFWLEDIEWGTAEAEAA